MQLAQGKFFIPLLLNSTQGLVCIHSFLSHSLIVINVIKEKLLAWISFDSTYLNFKVLNIIISLHWIHIAMKYCILLEVPFKINDGKIQFSFFFHSSLLSFWELLFMLILNAWLMDYSTDEHKINRKKDFFFVQSCIAVCRL